MQAVHHAGNFAITYRTFLRFDDEMIVLERKGDDVPVRVLAGVISGSDGVLHHGRRRRRRRRRGNVHVLHHLRFAHVSGYV